MGNDRLDFGPTYHCITPMMMEVGIPNGLHMQHSGFFLGGRESRVHLPNWAELKLQESMWRPAHGFTTWLGKHKHVGQGCQLAVV